MAAHGRRRPSSVVKAGALALATPLLLASCELPRFGAPDAASEEGGHVVGLYQGFFLAAIAVVLVVWLPLAFVLVRYRRQRHDDGIPSQRAYNIPLEVAYTVVPVLIVAVLFFFSVRTEGQVTGVARDPAARVEVVGFQWSWQFRYDDGVVVEAPPGEEPQLVLPVGVPSNLRLRATDVNHAFWVPRFLSKRDLIPGVRNEITVTPTEVGTFQGRCAEFCGLDHWRMGFTVRVVSEDEFATWLQEQQAAGR